MTRGSADGAARQLENDRTLHQFIAHASLDMVERMAPTVNGPYLKVVDRYGEWLVSAFIASSGDRLLLLHDARNEDGIRQFFAEAHELWTRLSLNPFYTNGAPIESGPFEVKIRLMGKRYLEK